MASKKGNWSEDLQRFKRLPVLPRQSWQGGIVDLPVWIEDEKTGGPWRARGAVWVARPSGEPQIEPLEEDADEGEVALRGLVALTLQLEARLGGRPARLELQDPILADRLGRLLGDAAPVIDLVGELADVRKVLRQFAAFEHGSADPPDALTGSGVTVERMRAFAEAARRFHEAAPWEHLTNEDLIAVESDVPDPRMRHLIVMGNGGMEFGLAFFGSPEEHEAGGPLADRGKARPRRFWGVSFERGNAVPFDDLCLFDDHRLPLAGPKAYPLAMGYLPGRAAIRPDAGRLAFMERVLLALAETTEVQMDSGRWSCHVESSDGPAEVRFALPTVLDEPVETLFSPRRMPDRRAMERTHAEIGRFLRAHQFDSLEDADRALQERFTGRLPDEIESTAETPVERAQDLCYRAFEARGRRRVILARQALEISRDCADAWVLLAEHDARPERARTFYERGVEAGERALGRERFRRMAGAFWGDHETRPYMRARFGLAQTLEALGEVEAAVGHYRGLLRLNPNDNQGARYELLTLLLDEARDDEARRLLADYKDDAAAEWQWAGALLSYRRDPLGAAARVALGRALEANPHVLGYLSDPERLERPLPSHYALGSDDEAAACAIGQYGAWEATPGAIDWAVAVASELIDRRRRPSAHSKAKARSKAREAARARARNRRR